MKWYEATSVEELRQLGKLSTVKRQISKDIKKMSGRKNLDGFIKIGSNSWKGQYEKIVALKKLAMEFSLNSNEILDLDNNKVIKSGQVNNKADSCDFFKSKADRYIFCLLELGGEERVKQLNIYKSLYINKTAAKEWYIKIAKEIHPDNCNNVKATEAMAELTAIYDKMVSNE